MGPIIDRSRENLVATDKGIVMARRRLLRAAKALLDNGTAPPGVDPAHQRVRSASVVLPRIRRSPRQWARPWRPRETPSTLRSDRPGCVKKRAQICDQASHLPASKRPALRAASLYRKILATNPKHADALNLLGLIEIQRKTRRSNTADRPGDRNRRKQRHFFRQPRRRAAGPKTPGRRAFKL